MNTKREALILKLIRHLVDSDESTAEMLHHNPNNAVSTFPEMNTNTDLNGFKNQVSQQFQYVQEAIVQLKEQMAHLQNGNAPTTSSNTVSSLNTNNKQTNGHESSTYTQVLEDTVLQAEFQMQAILPNAFIATQQQHKEYFLWSGIVQSQIRLVFLQTPNDSVSNRVLNIVGHQLLNEICYAAKDTIEMMRFLNRKCAELLQKYAQLSKEITASIVIVDKKQAKIFCSNAQMHAFVMEDKKLQTHKGAEAFLGNTQAQFTMQTIDIKRGMNLYIGHKDLPTTEVEATTKTIQDATLPDKKAKINEWLAKQKPKYAVLGIAF
ncbi:MAG: hypothetical protein EAZ55_03775 [Cytophagales bacterium]|nr:MAG: hypothetical protein EAZ55_03775 [Cytophagales bacterium]